MNRRVLVEMARRRARPGTGSSVEMLKRRTAEVEWPRVDLALHPVLSAVVGGVATRQYMAERRTQDIDVAVLQRDADRARARLTSAGYTYLGTLSIGGSRWRSPEGPEIDLLEVREPWWSEALEQAQANRDLQGLPVLPLPYLALLKLRASRAQDLADVSRMMGQATDEDVAATRAVFRRLMPEDLDDLASLVELGRLEFQ